MTRSSSLRHWLYTGVLVSASTVAMAQQRPGKNGQPPATPGNAPAMPAPAKPGPKPYSEVVGKAKTQKGLFLVHKVDDRYLFEIPDSLFNREFLVMTHVARAGVDLRGSNSMSGYAGDEVNSNVISFEKGPNNKVFLLKKSFSEFSSDSTREMFMAVTRSNMQPIAASFDVKSAASDSNGVVIDLTDYISGDNDILHFDNNEKGGWKLGGYQPDKSYISEIKSFPLNTNIKAVKTYARAAGNPMMGPMGGGPGGGTVTVELTTSFVVLPKVPMQARYFDPRVGYFAEGYTDFDQNPQGVKKVVMAKRWRLEPKPADIEKYKKGELVEPAKPIVIYIDPATPAKWVPYLIQGVNDWQKAFEQAGFKNAIVAKKAPTPQEDPTWSMDDARNSVIVYKPSSVPNASGPSTADPRSGEILETHINWYHNVMELLHDWYMVQASTVDPRARKNKFDDELMGQLIRFVSSHEVGHTLGLRHNFGSSSSVPVEKMRDKKWVEENGHTPSIMDYARFNYVAQPEDNISEKGIFPRIGDYDTWAIEWGYKWFDNKSVDEETAILAKLTTEKASNKRLWFGTESNPDDPRSQSEDLGDNAMLASTYGIKNLQRILPELPKWTATPNEGYKSLSTMYGQITGQFSRYIGHVSKNIGGIMETPKTVEQAGVVYERVSKERQKEAMEWLKKNVFTTPTWLFNKEIAEKTGVDQITLVGRLQDMALERCLSSRTYDKLIAGEAESGAAAYTASDLTTDLRNAVFTELKTQKPIDIYRRNLQKNYVSRIGKILNPPAAAPSAQGNQMGAMFGPPPAVSDRSDAFSILKSNMKQLRSEIKAALPATADKASRAHLEDLVERINKMLDPK
ncbi:zinc-dependent metalloprotease [Pseudoflavitalea sp. G-6-1-2]|uniref:zinc-dependent metalloprotease n=1 Tax=Pseudoflavitalea sp. G-6-1-2 TaxID=2728841 RepID=UPI00146EBE48|nr:zinc-dependent metalloprotease [Pseudoflavitalea sp. G-6-1-2]NML22336.1 zinc-dependent metalloprotease [Pseudoflavitalea sp. G-6-1-2]